MNYTKTLRGAACTVIACAGAMLAQGQGWTGKVGDAANDKVVLAETLKEVGPGDCVEFTRRTLRAVTRLPLDSNTKATRYVETSLLCVGNAPGMDIEDGKIKYSTIAETVALAPVAYLPGLVKDMAKSFEPEVNSLSNEQYLEIAEKGVKACFKRNGEVEDTTVRNTFAIILFTRAASRVPGLQDALLALVPERSRELTVKWLTDASRDDFEGILAAAEIDITPPTPAINMLGYPHVARLLANLAMTEKAMDALLVARGLGSSLDSVDIQLGYGFQQIPARGQGGRQPPVGYQNQGLSLWGMSGGFRNGLWYYWWQ
ncbi:MAG: hypothetical protein FWH21_02045 [Kiritimatiellaeota bacterium]|nr:hypothetical protein [Kiritimatiellota bacterium]